MPNRRIPILQAGLRPPSANAGTASPSLLVCVISSPSARARQRGGWFRVLLECPAVRGSRETPFQHELSPSELRPREVVAVFDRQANFGCFGRSFSLRLRSIDAHLPKLFRALGQTALALRAFFRRGRRISDLVDRPCGQLGGAQPPIGFADRPRGGLHGQTKLD